MSRKNGHVPAYRLHKASGQARVIVNREHIYLGIFGSAESREEYARLIAELAAGHSPPGNSKAPSECGEPISVNQTILAYWVFVKGHFIKDGKTTREVDNIRDALRPLRQLYGSTPAAEFGPKKLKAVRQKMIENGLCRRVINNRVGRIKRMFKWAVADELVPPGVFHGLQAVTGLAYGRTKARETEPVKPIQLQRISGMRAGEVVIMRPCDIDMTSEVWIYEPSDHKNRWRGHRKEIALGPEAQRIIEPFLARDPQAFLFSPQEVAKWRQENCPSYHGSQRKTKIYPSELRRRQRVKEARRKQRKRRQPTRGPGDRYDTKSYARAIDYGLAKAKKAGFAVPHWHPHQLRHNRGTEVRRKYGIEAAQVALGHSKADTTQIYAERDMEKARQIAKEMG
ncbi:MAG: tyrosine-type recombinase/integrase [Thermoguttaceae bacterium]